MTVVEHLREEGIEYRSSDIILVCPDFAFKKIQKGKRNRKKENERLVIEFCAGKPIDEETLIAKSIFPCHTLAEAEFKIEEVASRIHNENGRAHGVGIYFRRMSERVIRCDLWKD